MSKLRVIREAWLFMRVTKKYWLAPILFVLLAVGLLLLVAKTSALSPFVYALF